MRLGDQDGRAFAQFIRDFLSKYHRWNSPKYIFGESYGTMRAAVLAQMLQNDMQIDLNGVPVALADLQGELERLRATMPEVAVVIRSHKELAVQRLVDVMDAVQRAKITKVGVVTTPEAP